MYSGTGIAQAGVAHEVFSEGEETRSRFPPQGGIEQIGARLIQCRRKRRRSFQKVHVGTTAECLRADVGIRIVALGRTAPIVKGVECMGMIGRTASKLVSLSSTRQAIGA